MKRLILLTLLTALLASGISYAEPHSWTLSNLDPDGIGTAIRDEAGDLLDGTFEMHLVLDVDGDGPDQVHEDGPDIGMPGGDDILVVSSTQSAPMQFIQPAGAFTLFLTVDPILEAFPEEAWFYVRVYDGQNLVLGTRYTNSLSFQEPHYPSSAQTVVEVLEGMSGYIGNESPLVFVLPSAPTVLAGEQLVLNVQITDDEETTVRVLTDELPGGLNSVLIDQEDEGSATVRWAVPLNAEGDNEITIAVSDGDLQTLTTIPVNVLAADDRPAAFQPITPVDEGTAWEGASTSWQMSQHPDGLEITYNFIWATDEEFSDADSVTALIEQSVQLHYAEIAAVPIPRRDIISISQSSKRGRDGNDQLDAMISTPTRNARASKSNATQLSAQEETVPARSREDRRRNPQQPLDGEDAVNHPFDTIVNTNILPGTTYYWKVRAIASDDTDRYSHVQSAVAEIPDPPEAFDLLEPTDASVVTTISPTFRWRAAFDPDINDTLSYDLIWSADGGSITDTIFAIPDTLFDMTGEDLDFDGAERFQSWLMDEAQNQRNQIHMHSVPVIQPIERPSELDKLQRSRSLKGRVSENQTMQLSDDAAQSGESEKRIRKTLQPLSDEQDELEIDDLVDHTLITWFVEVEDATGNRTSASDVFTFTVDAPDLPGGFDPLSPADSLFVHNQIDITLSWTESLDNDPGQEVLYDVLATSDPGVEDISDFPVIAAGISETSHVLSSGAQDDLEWRWTVRGISAGDTVWMSEQAMHVFVTRNDQPTEFALTYPENSALIPTTTPTLEWEEAVDTDLFDQVTYSLFWTLDEWATSESAVGLTSTSYTLDIGLEDNQSVRWNVLAVDLNSEGRWAVGQEGYGFEIYIDDPPTTFALTEPEDGSLIVTPTFTLVWQESFDPDEAGPITYIVETSDDIEFTEPTEHDAGEDTSLVVQTAFIGTGEFWWRVVAEDATEQRTYSSNTWSLLLDYNSVPEWARGIPTEFAIARSYPNPFNPVLTVVIASPKPGAHIAVTMHNILGREVERRTWRPSAAGYKSISFNMNGHSSGAYFVRMHADGQVIETQRVTYLK